VKGEWADRVPTASDSRTRTTTNTRTKWYGYWLLAIDHALRCKRGIDHFALVGQDWGSRAAHAVAVLAPERVTGLLVLATGYGAVVDDPEVRLRQAHVFWYQWWFHTAAGRQALEHDREKLCEYLWRVWSPACRFSAEEFAAILPSFQNEQFVDTVIHYYRHRWGAAPSSPLYESQETKLRDTPPIPVPAVFMCGTSDACNLPESSRGNTKAYPAGVERVELAGVGHFVQRERPAAVAGYTRMINNK
jgi:pimeloyl-ACP methyl ester carboxylesterase